MSPQSIRILPVMILVAMLAFSVRLVDVVRGVSSLSGSAYAEEKAEPKKDEKTENKKPDQSDLKIEDDQKPSEEEQAKAEEAKKKEEQPKADLPEDTTKPDQWRDAKDEDPTYELAKEELYKELVDRRKDIESREQQLQTREALLKAAEKELDRKYQELSQLRGELETLLKTQESQEKERVQSLVKIYEGMKPKDAARIFDTLDLDILVEVAGMMQERKISPIIAAMNPDRAQTLTIRLAEQKKLPTLPGAE